MPHAKIFTKMATAALEKLHAELGGKILQNKKEALRLAEDMLHVEAVLKLLNPNYDVRPIAVRRRKPNRWYKRGTIFRHALDVLRAAERPLTVNEITERMLTAKGVTNPDHDAKADLQVAVTSSLRNHSGKTVKNTAQGIPARWSLT
jgi:hypothetical protein